MTFSKLKALVKSDLYRYTGDSGSSVLKHVLRGEPGFKYSFWMRSSRFCEERRLWKLILFHPAVIILKHYMFKYGIAISPDTEIGPGFYIGHFGGIVVNPQSRIGKNCNLSQSVTIGQINRGAKKGSPTIGNNVYIGPGAKIIGNISIGDKAAIGANCVVVKNIPENAVVVGVPGRIISYDGSYDYVNRTDYDQASFDDANT
jgi:serine O-acetyltransferase